MKKIAIIGGSGFENPDILQNARYVDIKTPFGNHDSRIRTGKICGTDVCLISRHGVDHTVTPTHVNNRANIWAIKELGCTCIIATSACGSLRKEIEPGELIFPDQMIDFTVVSGCQRMNLLLLFRMVQPESSIRIFPGYPVKGF